MPDSVRRRQFIKAAGGGSVTVSLAGCTLLGDSGGDDTLVVGATVPETGRLAELGEETRRGYELGVERINANGGVDGSEIELRIEDDEGDPEVALSELQRIIDEDDPAMLWGSITSPMVGAGTSIAEREGIPFLGVGFAHEAPHEQNSFEWSYVPYPKSRHVASGTRRLLDGVPESERPTRVAIWEPNTGWGAEMASAWESELSGDGYEVVLHETFSTGASDFSSLISASRSAEAGVLLSNPFPPTGITAVNQMESNEWAPEAMMFVRASHSNGWWGALGGKGAYTTTSPGWVPGLSGNGNQQFRSSYTDEYDTGGMTIPVTVGGAYNLTQVAATAFEAADDTDPDALRSALRSETFETVIGTFEFEDNGVITGDEFDTPTGQWWEREQRLVYPDSDSDLAMDFRYPVEPWSAR